MLLRYGYSSDKNGTTLRVPICPCSKDAFLNSLAVASNDSTNKTLGTINRYKTDEQFEANDENGLSVIVVKFNSAFAKLSDFTRGKIKNFYFDSLSDSYWRNAYRGIEFANEDIDEYVEGMYEDVEEAIADYIRDLVACKVKETESQICELFAEYPNASKLVKKHLAVQRDKIA